MDFEMMPIPEEIKEQLRKQYDEQHMHIESFRHDVQRIFEEVTLDQLVTLRHLFNHIAQAGQVYPAYLEGVAAASLKYRFNVCPSCGVDHDKELLEQPEKETAPQAEQLTLEQAAYEADCERFGVTPTGNGEDVMCDNCAKVYVSLADRMIKPPGPENCPGCVHKAKWG